MPAGPAHPGRELLAAGRRRPGGQGIGKSRAATKPGQVLIRKVALVIALAIMGLVYLGWMPRERANTFMRGMVAFFVLGFIWRVGAWMMSP